MKLGQLFGRRLRKWLVAGLLSLPIMSALLIRTYCLWRVPDVDLPADFHVQSQLVLPVAENAFTYYETTAKLLNSRKPEWLNEAVNQAVDESEPRWDDRLDNWLAESRDILLAYRAATEVEKAAGPDIKTMNLDTELPRHQELWQLSKLAAVEAQRCIQNGKLDNAWDWYVAGLRCARHSEEPGIFICQVVANSIRRLVFRGIASWSQDSSLTAEQLRRRRNELIALAHDRKSTRELIIGEYCSFQHTWNCPHGFEVIFADAIPDVEAVKKNAVWILLKNSILWTLGQPEVWLRLQRQLIVNGISQFDQPLHLRRQYTISGRSMVFELKDDKLEHGQLAADALQNALENLFLTLGMPTRAFVIDGFDGWRRADHSRIDLLTIVLASQEFHRVHARLPTTLDELVPRFLDGVPFDPMDMRGVPIRYRMIDDLNAIAWSVGMDGIDDGAEIRGKDSNDVGYSIKAG